MQKGILLYLEALLGFLTLTDGGDTAFEKRRRIYDISRTHLIEQRKRSMEDCIR